LKPLFASKPLGIVMTKIDLRAFEDLPKDKKDLVNNLITSESAFHTFISNNTKEGITDTKNKACETLRAHRDQLKSKKVVSYERNMPTIAQPKPRDTKVRTPNIPAAVNVHRSVGKKPERVNYKDV
jgi:nucleolar GTP-binding protein